MYTSVLQVLIFTTLVLGFTVNVHRGTMEVSKTQIPLQSMVITCGLTDIIIIAAPIVAGKKARYYLTNPQEEFRKLDIDTPRYKPQDPSSFETIKIKFFDKIKVITPANEYKVFNVNFGHLDNETADIFAEKEDQMEMNEFMIGPISEDDYGNWMLSAIYKDSEGELIELYKVITFDIIEPVPGAPSKKELRVGETFELGFAYPILNLESCELIAPKSTFDRFYDRRRAKPDTCGYVVKNVTSADTGIWNIIGVGRITYHAMVALKVV